jgi:ABC-type proline/glycine betaine transport system permease subunit
MMLSITIISVVAVAALAGIAHMFHAPFFAVLLGFPVGVFAAIGVVIANVTMPIDKDE